MGTASQQQPQRLVMPPASAAGVRPPVAKVGGTSAGAAPRPPGKVGIGSHFRRPSDVDMDDAQPGSFGIAPPATPQSQLDGLLQPPTPPAVPHHNIFTATPAPRGDGSPPSELRRPVCVHLLCGRRCRRPRGSQPPAASPAEDALPLSASADEVSDGEDADDVSPETTLRDILWAVSRSGRQTARRLAAVAQSVDELATRTASLEKGSLSMSVSALEARATATPASSAPPSWTSSAGHTGGGPHAADLGVFRLSVT